MLVRMDPKTYFPNVVYKKGKKVLYIEVLKAIYGMLQSYILSYINMRKYLDTDGFKFNSYDPCVANNIIKGDPLTLVSRVDDLKVSHRGKCGGKF